jgi:hypothetical protein
MDVSLVRVVCCQIEVPATGWSLVQRSYTDCSVSDCDREALMMRRPWSPRGWWAMEKSSFSSNTLNTIYVVFYVFQPFDAFQVALKFLLSRGRWLLFFSAPSIDNFFSNIKIPHDCEFFVTQPFIGNDEKEDGISITEIYQDHPSRSLQKHLVAHWTLSGGLNWSASLLIQRRADLHGISIRVGLNSKVSTTTVCNLLSHISLNFAVLEPYIQCCIITILYLELRSCCRQKMQQWHMVWVL